MHYSQVYNFVNNDIHLFCFRFIRQERFRTITQSYYRSANAVIIGNKNRAAGYFGAMINMYRIVGFCAYHINIFYLQCMISQNVHHF